jgi:hypothetical protein
MSMASAIGTGPRAMRAASVSLVVRHRDEVLALPLADLEDRRDIRVVESAGRPRLAYQPRFRCVALQGIGVEEFERDLAIERFVLCEVDHAHPPRPSSRMMR